MVSFNQKNDTGFPAAFLLCGPLNSVLCNLILIFDICGGAWAKLTLEQLCLIKPRWQRLGLHWRIYKCGLAQSKPS